MRRWRWIFGVLLAALLTGCGEPPEQPPDAPPAVPEEAPEELPEVRPPEEDRVIYSVEAELGEGVSGRLELYGKQFGDFCWGVRSVTWTPEGGEEPACAFDTRTAIEADWAEAGLTAGEREEDYYTGAWHEDGGLVLADFNFDGYLDVALQAATPAYNLPHYYWMYQPETGQFAYAFTHPGLAEVLPEQKLLVYDYHSTPEYYTSYWGYDENGELYLAHRNTMEYRNPIISANEYHGDAVTQLTEAELAEFAAYFHQEGRIGLLRDEGQEDMDIPSYEFTDGCRFLDGTILLYYHITGEMSPEWNWPMHVLLNRDGEGGWRILRVHPDGSY